MSTLLPDPALAAVTALIGLVLGLWLVPYAARRTVAQPLEIAVQDEVRLLLGVLSDLRRLPYLTTLAASDFAVGAHGRIWAGLLNVAEPELSTMSADPDEQECARVGELLVDRAAELHQQLHQVLSASPHASVDLERVSHLSSLSAQEPVTDDDVVDAGQAVLLTGTDRSKFAGTGRVAPTSTPDSLEPGQPPLRRVLTPPSRLRRVLSAIVGAVTGAVVPAFATATGLVGVSYWLTVATLLVLLAGCVVIALVDIDTFYVDLRTFVATTVVAWVLTIASVGSGGQWARLVPGVVVVAAVAVLFEVANRLYRWRRGVDGQGFGDTLIVVITVGVPPALTGDWTLGYFSWLAAMATAVVGWGVGALVGKMHRSSPMALGPYLAAGWVVGWVGALLLQ